MLALHIYNNKSKQSLYKFFFITFSLSTELLEDNQRFKLGGVDTSPTYLLFQTLLTLSWTLSCMIWMELTRTDVVFSRITMMLFYVQKTKVLGMTWNSTEYLTINNKKILTKDEDQGAHTLSTRVGGTPPPRVRPLHRGPPVDPPTPTPTLYICFQRGKKSGRKNHRVLRYGAAVKP